MLKTIANLQGVNILSKAAQKKVGGGRLQACGVIVTYPGSTTKYVLFTPDENGNGATKDEAMYTAANSNTISNNNGGYVNVTGNYCCAQCSNFPPVMN